MLIHTRAYSTLKPHLNLTGAARRTFQSKSKSLPAGSRGSTKKSRFRLKLGTGLRSVWRHCIKPTLTLIAGGGHRAAIPQVEVEGGENPKERAVREREKREIKIYCDQVFL